MSEFLQHTRIEIERAGVRASVPNNDVARLMYYMKCVFIAIDCNHDQDMQRFTNYRNWAQLSIIEQKALIVGCNTFSPGVLDDKVFFHSDALCGSCMNEFYTVSQVRHQFLAAESIVVAGRSRQVNKIMTYKMPWMKAYYFDPMERLLSRLAVASEHTVLISGQTYRAIVVQQPVQPKINSNVNHVGIAACIAVTVVIVIVIVIIIVTYDIL